MTINSLATWRMRVDDKTGCEWGKICNLYLFSRRNSSEQSDIDKIEKIKFRNKEGSKFSYTHTIFDLFEVVEKN